MEWPYLEECVLFISGHTRFLAQTSNIMGLKEDVHAMNKDDISSEAGVYWDKYQHLVHL